MPKNDEKTLCCSFCGKGEHEVYHLFAGNGVCICNECVELCDIVIGNDVTIGKYAFAMNKDLAFKVVEASEEGKKLLAKWGIVGDFVGVGHLALGYRDCDYPAARERKENYIVRV